MSISSRNLNHHWRCRDQNENFDNLGHKILEIYNVLVQIRLTASKTKRDIQYSKIGIHVISSFGERLKT